MPRASEFVRSSIYPNSGKREPIPDRRIVAPEELAKLLPQQTRRVLTSLLKRDGGLMVKSTLQSLGKKKVERFTVKLSPEITNQFGEISTLKFILNALHADPKYSDPRQRYVKREEILREMEAIKKLIRIVEQQRKMIEDVLNGYREAPSEAPKPPKYIYKKLGTKLPPKLRKRESFGGGPRGEVNPKGCPYAAR